jgi:anti-sigma factor RsiW
MSEHDYSEQTKTLKQEFDTVMTEPIPARMFLRRPPWIGYARSAMLIAVGIAIGLAIPVLRTKTPDAQAIAGSLMATRAARAHAIYAAEVRHPVEVEAAQKDHLVKWLSKRLDLELKIPVLATEGFELLGGRLLPAPEGPVAQFMYQDSSGKRLTLYVTRRNRTDSTTAFRFAKEGPVSVFYWIDPNCGYALSGELDKPALFRVATSVYRQLEP